MTTAARILLSAVPPADHANVCYPFSGPVRTQWSYFPGPRTGIALSDLDAAGRKAAHRLLATALSRSAFAQAVTIMAFEEVLDLDEGGQLGRSSDGYHVTVFGDPGDDAWAWRFEGHHLSVNVTVIAGQPVIAPLFLGANPAQVRHDGQPVVAPLLREEELARAIITGLPHRLREHAVIGDTAPADIVTGTAACADESIEPLGIAASLLPRQARDQFGQLLRGYLDRLAPGLAEAEQHRLAGLEAAFAWAGGLAEGDPHYYRIQAPGLLVEYDNTQGNLGHAHTVLRRPGDDFGASVLPAHLASGISDPGIR